MKERACRPPCVAGSSDSLTASACSLLSVFASKFGATGRPRFHLLPLPKPAPAFLVALACWDETSESLRQNAHGKSTSDTVTAVAWFSLAFLQIGRCNRPSTLRLLAMLSLTSLSSLHGFFAWRTGLESGERFSACRYFFFFDHCGILYAGEFLDRHRSLYATQRLTVCLNGALNPEGPCTRPKSPFYLRHLEHLSTTRPLRTQTTPCTDRLEYKAYLRRWLSWNQGKEGVCHSLTRP